MRSTAARYFELCKPRVVALIVFTAVVGMFLAVPGWPPTVALLAGTAGIALAASSAACPEPRNDPQPPASGPGGDHEREPAAPGDQAPLRQRAQVAEL